MNLTWSAVSYSLCFSIFLRNIDSALQEMSLSGKGEELLLQLAAAVMSYPKRGLYLMEIIYVNLVRQ